MRAPRDDDDVDDEVVRRSARLSFLSLTAKKKVFVVVRVVVAFLLALSQYENFRRLAPVRSAIYDVVVWQQQQQQNGGPLLLRSNGNVTRALSPPRPFSVKRHTDFDSLFVPGSNHQKLRENADANGTVLDFAVGGFPKCGTTTMIANLGHIAPVPAADVCTPWHKTVWYAHRGWPDRHDPGRNKTLRGVKCPMMLDGYPPVAELSRHLPRTRLIVGVRHPVLWFQSFYNMQARNDGRILGPYAYAGPPCIGAHCGRGGCRPRTLFCVNRAKFHLWLAQLGKTPLDEEELKLLPPEIKAQSIKNKVFLYEASQLSDTNEARREQLWDDIASFIGYPETIPHDKYHGSHGKGKDKDSKIINICDAEYDALRGMLMPFGWEISKWLCRYFIKGRDVYVSSADHFCEIIETYSKDPCGRLVRMDNGTYILDERFSGNASSTVRLRG